MSDWPRETKDARQMLMGEAFSRAARLETRSPAARRDLFTRERESSAGDDVDLIGPSIGPFHFRCVFFVPSLMNTYKQSDCEAEDGHVCGGRLSARALTSRSDRCRSPFPLPLCPSLAASPRRHEEARQSNFSSPFPDEATTTAKTERPVSPFVGRGRRVAGTFSRACDGAPRRARCPVE